MGTFNRLFEIASKALDKSGLVNLLCHALRRPVSLPPIGDRWCAAPRAR